jgi:hypothetical protein
MQPPPQTLRVGRGYAASWIIQLRDERRRDIRDLFSGGEPLDLRVGGDDGRAAPLDGSTVAWNSPAAGTILLSLSDADTAGLSAGPRGLSVRLLVGGGPVEVYRATLRVEPRAAADSLAGLAAVLDDAEAESI